jgi:hypothetical protein
LVCQILLSCIHGDIGRAHLRADNSAYGAANQAKRFLAPAEKALYDAGQLDVKLIKYCPPTLLLDGSVNLHCDSSVWRPLVEVVENYPLAFCDRRTAEAPDLVEIDRPQPGYVDHGCYVKYNPKQKWFWLSDQKATEPFIFLVWDSRTGGWLYYYYYTSGSHYSLTFLTAGSPHGAFFNSEETHSLPRQSVEVRLIALFKKEI